MWLDESHLQCAILFTMQFINPPQGLPQSRIKMIFDGVVGSTFEKIYLPRNNFEMFFHLLPYYLWALKSSYSSA